MASNIRQGITPTFTLTVPSGSVNLTEAKTVYATFTQTRYSITKSGSELVVRENEVDVYLSQEETLAFSIGPAEVQLNWVYTDGSRGETDIDTIEIDKTLLREVLT